MGIKLTIHEFCPDCGALNAFVRNGWVFTTGHDAMPGINNPAPRPHPLNKIIFVENEQDASEAGLREKRARIEDTGNIDIPDQFWFDPETGGLISDRSAWGGLIKFIRADLNAEHGRRMFERIAELERERDELAAVLDCPVKRNEKGNATVIARRALARRDARVAADALQRVLTGLQDENHECLAKEGKRLAADVPFIRIGDEIRSLRREAEGVE